MSPGLPEQAEPQQPVSTQLDKGQEVGASPNSTPGSEPKTFGDTIAGWLAQAEKAVRTIGPVIEIRSAAAEEMPRLEERLAVLKMRFEDVKSELRQPHDRQHILANIENLKRTLNDSYLLMAKRINPKPDVQRDREHESITSRLESLAQKDGVTMLEVYDMARVVEGFGDKFAFEHGSYVNSKGRDREPYADPLLARTRALQETLSLDPAAPHAELVIATIETIDKELRGKEDPSRAMQKGPDVNWMSFSNAWRKYKGIK